MEMTLPNAGSFLFLFDQKNLKDIASALYKHLKRKKVAPVSLIRSTN